MADIVKATPPKPKTKMQEPSKVNGKVHFGSKAKEDEQSPPSVASIKTWRELRKDPTIALARAVATAPIRAADYGVEADEDVPDEQRQLVEAFAEAHWQSLIDDMVYSLDYGWQSFEKIPVTISGTQIPGNYDALTNKVYQWIAKMKPLLPETTRVVIRKKTGAYNGLRNTSKVGGGLMGTTEQAVYLRPEESFWYTHDRECDNYYGESVMERARKAADDWDNYNGKMNEYAAKNAAPIPIVEYPEGENKNKAGTTVSNDEIAAGLLKHLGKSLGVAFPSAVGTYMDLLIKKGMDPEKVKAWKIEFLETSGSHGQEFIDMLRHKDVLKMRAWLVPERAAMEGQYGTKAESETQGDLVLVSADLELQMMVSAINEDVINHLLLWNFGETAVGKVRITTERLDPFRSMLLREIVKGIFGAPVNADLFMDTLAADTILEMLGVPVKNVDMAPTMENRQAAESDRNRLEQTFIAELSRNAKPSRNKSSQDGHPELGFLDGSLYQKDENGLWIPYDAR